MECPTCQAYVTEAGVLTALFFLKERNPRFILSHIAFNTRCCRYARQRGKQCSNPCTAIDPNETMEARLRSLGTGLHPEVQEVVRWP